MRHISCTTVTMPNVLRRAAVAFSVAAACTVALTVPAAHAATTSPPPGQATNIWAGYYAEASAPIIAATADFTVPHVACDQSRGTPQTGNDGIKYQAFMWAGIGGIDGYFGINSGWLKQAGVAVNCTSLDATPKYQPFWEIVPPSGTGGPVYFKDENEKTAELQPGENVRVEVIAPSASPVKGQWYFQIYAGFPNGPVSTFTEQQTLPASDNGPDQTAEVITEKHASGLVYLGTVEYNTAQYLTTQTETGLSIASHPIYVVNSTYPHAKIIYAGAPYDTAGGTLADAFNTYYATDWLR